MNKSELLELKKKIASLSEKENRERNRYLRGLATGEIQGPPTGFPTIDKINYKYYDEEALDYELPRMSIYEYVIKERMAKTSLSDIAFEYMILKISNRKFLNSIDVVSKAFKNYGIKPGDCVSICLPNFPEVAYAFYALNKLGAVVNFIDPRSAEDDIKQLINKSGSKLLITMDVSVSDNPNDTVISKISSIIDDTGLERAVVVNPLTSFPKFIQKIIKYKQKDLDIPIPEDDRFISWDNFIAENYNLDRNVKVSSYYKKDSPAIVCYTGGTTGLPKGAVMTNENLLSVLEMNKYNKYNVSASDRALNIAPPWTYYGINNALNAFLCMGLDVIMVPKAEAGELGELVNKLKPNHIITVPSELDSIVGCEKLKNFDLSFLKTTIVGASRLIKEVEERFNNFLGEHNCSSVVTKGYGATEVTASCAYTVPGTNIYDAVGVGFVGTNIGIFNIDDPNEELMVNESGEIAVTGDTLMLYYLGNDEATNELLIRHDDGTVWAHLKDKGKIDENGILYCFDRYKRMFMRNGYKVFPDSVENKIMEFSNNVENCCVVDVDDSVYGSIGKAYVVLKNKDGLNLDDLSEKLKLYLQSKLYDYEVPDLIEFIDKIPLTPMFKTDFMALREDANKKYKENGNNQFVKKLEM